MNDIFTESLARNICYGGTIFGVLLFLILTFDTIWVLSKRNHHITPQVALGKLIFEKNNCIGCHTLLGNGAYYAPELSNVYKRRGSDIDGEAFIKHWLRAVPTLLLKRRQMPQFNLSEEELDALFAFLKWTSEINTANWPPNIEG